MTQASGAAAYPQAHSLTYRPEIDGLRAIAVSSVILYHAGVWPFGGGYVGVDIFFVISGYLITSILLSDMDRGKFSFVQFYERRIRRIFPALFLVLACASVAAWLLLTPGQLRYFGQSVLATVLFLANFLFAWKTDYFAGDSELLPLIHMWSLAVEEQFYVVFPVILLALRRWRIMGLNTAFTVLFALSLAWCLYSETRYPVANFFLMPGRAWELLAGAIVAVNREKWAAANARATGMALEAIGLALIVVPILWYTRDTAFPGIAAIAPVAGTALLLFAAAPERPVGRVLASGPMVAIGLLSYSAYLWHQPLFAFAHAWSGVKPDVATTAALIAATFALAWVSWRFVERPFRSREAISRRTVFALAAVFTLAFAAIGLLTHVKQGFPARYDAKTLALAATMAPSPVRDTCHTEGVNYRPPARACRYLGNTVDWAVLGDSHAIEIGYALAEDLAKSGHGLMHLTFSGCQAALTFDTPNPGCSAWMKEAVATLERETAVRNVVLIFRPSFYLFGDQTKTWPAVPDAHPGFLPALSSEAAREEYWKSFRTTVERLHAAGKRVYVVLPIPDLPVHAERYVFGRHDGATGVTMDWYRARNAWILPRLQSLPGVTLLDPVPTVCRGQQCASIIDDTALYFDDNHFSLAGARRFVGDQRAKRLLP